MAPIPLKDRTGDVRGPWRIVELAPERFRVVSETGRVLSTRAIWRAECLVCGYRTEHIWQCLPRHCPECKRLAEEQEMMEAFDAQRRGVPCPSVSAKVARKLPRQPRKPPRGPRRLRNGPQAPRHNERRERAWALMADGASDASLAREFGVTRETARQWRTQWLLRPQVPTQSRRPESIAAWEDWARRFDEALAALDDGRRGEALALRKAWALLRSRGEIPGLRRLSLRLGLASTTARRIALRLGLPRPPRGRGPRRALGGATAD